MVKVFCIELEYKSDASPLYKRFELLQGGINLNIPNYEVWNIEENNFNLHIHCRASDKDKIIKRYIKQMKQLGFYEIRVIKIYPMGSSTLRYTKI